MPPTAFCGRSRGRRTGAEPPVRRALPPVGPSALRGVRLPSIPSTKGFTRHTFGACGTLELAFCIAMMRDELLAPNRNLRELDPECAHLDCISDEPRPVRADRIMSNDFVFNGINTSLILGRNSA